MKKISLSLTVCSALFISGCTPSMDAISPHTGKIGGTAIGMGAGAAIGNQVGGREGALIGAAVGGLLGYLIGNDIDKRRAELAKIAKEENIEVYSSDIKQNDLSNEIVSSTINTTIPQKTKITNAVIGDVFTIISKDNQFDVGSSKLNTGAVTSFNKFAKQYEGTNKKLLVIGHTDDSGSSSNNQKLSEERAKSVGEIFASSGIQQQNIYFLGAGETLPVADNNTPDGASKNRRVEIVELQSEEDIAKFASARISNPKYFKQVAPAYIANAKKEISKKEPIVAPSEAKINTKTEVLSKKTVEQSVDTSFVAKENYSKVIKIADISGSKLTNNSFSLKENFGKPLNTSSSFSLISEAMASGSAQDVYVNCMYDKPRAKGETKSLATGENITYKTTEYKKGLYESSWVADIDNHLLGIAPIGVLSNGSKVSQMPNVFLYTNYVKGSNQKSDLKSATKVNTYQGTKGMLYRVFVDDESSQLRCMDIVFDETNVHHNSVGKLYYVQDDIVHEKEFEIKQIHKN